MDTGFARFCLAYGHFESEKGKKWQILLILAIPYI
jgi:hypothetical protein